MITGGERAGVPRCLSGAPQQEAFSPRSSFLTEPGPIRKILTHLGEPLESPLGSPARGPPTDWGELVQVTARNAERGSDLPP